MLHGCIIVPLFLLGTLQHKTWDGAQMFFQRLSDKRDFQAAVNYLWKSWELCGLHTVNILGNASTQHGSDGKRQVPWKECNTGDQNESFYRFPTSHWWTQIRGHAVCSALRRTSENHAGMVYYTTEIVWKWKSERCFLPHVFLVCGNGKPLTLKCHMQRN